MYHKAAKKTPIELVINKKSYTDSLKLINKSIFLTNRGKYYINPKLFIDEQELKQKLVVFNQPDVNTNHSFRFLSGV